MKCDWEDCELEAAYVVTFVGQAGHVHDCLAHTHELRQRTQVEHMQDMPCPLTHGSPSWIDEPRSI